MEMFIDGQWSPATSGAVMEVLNPRDSSLADTVPSGSASDADRAVRAAEAAFNLWKTTAMVDRVALARTCAAAMRDRAQELADLLHAELGRPMPGCLGEVASAAGMLEVCAEEGLRLTATMPLGQPAGERTIITRDPLGVVVAITPFNYPLVLLMFKLGAALVAGCTVVAKPAEDTPLSTLKLAEIFHDAGLPRGCFNAVTGTGAEIGAALVNHPTPRKIAFTGGTAAGKTIAAAATGTLKRVTLELGGHCAAIVCADSDLDKAAAAITRHGFANTGQFCYRVNRIYVERPVYDAFLAKLSAKAADLTLAPIGGEGDLGPMINEKIFATSEYQSNDAREKGARILCGGQRNIGEGFDRGFYFPPTLIADATDDMAILQDETFGPVIGIAPVDSAFDGLKRANDSIYGLAGFVFCGDLARGLSLCEGMEAGSVWLNDIQRGSPHAPFGGMKQSGIGREKGRYGVESYLEYKSIYLSYEVPS